MSILRAENEALWGGGRCTMLVSVMLMEVPSCGWWLRGWSSRFSTELEMTSLVTSEKLGMCSGLDSGGDGPDAV